MSDSDEVFKGEGYDFFCVMQSCEKKPFRPEVGMVCPPKNYATIVCAAP